MRRQRFQTLACERSESARERRTALYKSGQEQQPVHTVVQYINALPPPPPHPLTPFVEFNNGGLLFFVMKLLTVVESNPDMEQEYSYHSRYFALAKDNKMPVMAKSRASDRVSPQVKRKKKEERRRVPSRFKRFWFYLCWRKQRE